MQNPEATPGYSPSDRVDTAPRMPAVEVAPPVYVESLLDLKPGVSPWPEDPTNAQALESLLHRMKSTGAILNVDWDHTIAANKPLLDPHTLLLDPTNPKYLDDETEAAQTGRKESTELDNIDLLVLLALKRGVAINVTTGKDVNARIWASYMQKRVTDIAVYLGIADKKPDGEVTYRRTYADGRPKIATNHGGVNGNGGDVPLFIAFSTGNGGYTFDLINGEVIVDKPIPLSGWEGLHRDGDLLRDSTAQKRKDQIRGVGRRLLADVPESSPILPPRVEYNPSLDEFNRTPVVLTDQIHRVNMSPIQKKEDLTREVAPPLSYPEAEHRRLLQGDIRDFAVFTPRSTKVNLVLDIQRIIEDPELNRRWFERTGVQIRDNESLLRAVRELSGDWNVNCAMAKAQGVTYIDFTSGMSETTFNTEYEEELQEMRADQADDFFDKHQINKATGNRLVKNYLQGLLRTYGRLDTSDESVPVRIRKVHTLSGGDAPGWPRNKSTNDAPDLLASGGWTDYIGDERVRYNGYPVYLADFYGINPNKPKADITLTNAFFYDLFAAADHGSPAEFKWRKKHARHILEETQASRYVS